MRFIPTRVHGVLDYVSGAGLLLAPTLLGFRNARAAAVPRIIGGGALAYSLLTDYELGAVRKLPMTRHLQMDAVSGATLAASPWLFGFADDVRAPHVALGLFELIAAFTTKTVPADAG